MLKSSALKSIVITAESNEKFSPLKVKLQWVNLPEDDLTKGRNVGENSRLLFLQLVCVHCPFFEIYLLKKFFSQ
jgi:hypothetical protein